MIELLISNRFDNRIAMVWITKILSWIVDAIKDDENILLEGALMLRDQPMHVTAILMCEGDSQAKIIKLLQQPPGEFKDKYIASIIVEPSLVTEIETAEERTKREAAEAEAKKKKEEEDEEKKEEVKGS